MRAGAAPTRAAARRPTPAPRRVPRRAAAARRTAARTSSDRARTRSTITEGPQRVCPDRPGARVAGAGSRARLVPRTRSSHDLAAGTVANFGFKSGTRIIDLLVSFSIPKFAQRSRRMLASFGIGTLALALAATPAAAAERLVSSLSSHIIKITPSFTGTELVLFGIVEREGENTPRRNGYDIVATVKGPPATLVVRRKERLAGIWVNTDSRPFVQVPSYLATLSNRPVEEIVSLDVARRLQLGVRRTMLRQQIGPDLADVVRDDPFRAAFLRLKESRKLYVERKDAVTFLTSILYSATIPIPAGAPTGTYNIELKLFADRAPIASGTEAFDIAKFGFEQFVAESAVDHGLLYGLASAAMALLTGWLAAVMFRRD